MVNTNASNSIIGGMFGLPEKLDAAGTPPTVSGRSICLANVMCAAASCFLSSCCRCPGCGCRPTCARDVVLYVNYIGLHDKTLAEPADRFGTRLVIDKCQIFYVFPLVLLIRRQQRTKSSHSREK